MLPSQSMQAGQSRPQTPSTRAYSELSQSSCAAPRPICWAWTLTRAAAGRQPIVTGTSVLGLKFKDGVMLAADCLGASLHPPPS